MCKKEHSIEDLRILGDTNVSKQAQLFYQTVVERKRLESSSQKMARRWALFIICPRFQNVCRYW